MNNPPKLNLFSDKPITKTINVKIIYSDNYCLPKPDYKTSGASGVDLYANIVNDNGCINIFSGETVKVDSGISLEIPIGYEGQIRSRSGWSSKGIICTNAPGTIDSDYRGTIQILISNISSDTQRIKMGDRIAQIVFVKVERANFIDVENLTDTERGVGGFGSTGF